MIAQAAKMQENEAGDGTNFVISMCGELLTQAESLIKMGLHPVEILNGYDKASARALALMEGLSCHQPTNDELRNVDKLTDCIRAAIASKQFGCEDFLSELIAQASIYAMPKNANRFSVENIRV